MCPAVWGWQDFPPKSSLLFVRCGTHGQCWEGVVRSASQRVKTALSPGRFSYKCLICLLWHKEQSNKAEVSLWEFLHLSPSVLVIVCFIPGDPMESPTMPSKSYAPLWPWHNCWCHSKSTCQMTLNNPKPIRTWWLSQKTVPRIVCYSKLQNLRKSNIKVPAGMFRGSCFMHDFIPSIDYQRTEFVSQMLRIIS